MLLVIDIGNTNMTFGIYEKNELVKVFRLNSDNLSENEQRNLIRENCSEFQIDGCIIASVIKELDKTMKLLVDDIFNIDSILLSSKLKLNIKLKVENPESIGMDRVANSAGACEKYPLPLVVVDMGTATTFEAINKNGEFIGGAILPGVQTQLNSLYKNTSKLPKIAAGEAEEIIGNNTEKAILSGVIRGHACAVSGLIEEYRKEFDENLTVIFTGGFSKLISEYVTVKTDFIDSNLTLDGLKLLYELNS